jgi:hypothetical protein
MRLAGGGGIGREAFTAFAGGALAVLLGLALGIASASVAGGARRRKAKRAAATAMLAELRWIDAVLRRVAEQGSSASDLSLDHPIIAAGLGDLALFEPETAGRIADLHYHLRGVDHEMQRYRDNPKAWAGRLPDLDRLVRHKAVGACRVVPELSKALRREGGALPPPIAASEESGGKEGLPPTPFGEGESDDWTL